MTLESATLTKLVEDLNAFPEHSEERKRQALL
jgi:hypothetical protein